MNDTKPRILIVEDEPDAQMIYVDILKGAGYDVEGASDGDEAEEKAGAKQFHLILLDIIMPKKDGIQTLSNLRGDQTRFGHPRIVMLSNIGGDIAIDKAMELGADGYILKSDVEPGELLEVVKKYLGMK